MKILILAKFLPKDGATTHMYTLANGFSRMGHEVNIMSAGPTKDENAEQLFRENINDKIKHHKIGFPCYYNYSFFSMLIQLLKYICIIPKGLLILYKIKPDIIHVHYPVTSYLPWIYSKITGVKFVTTYHIKGITKQVLHRKANKAIAISSELKEEIENRWMYKENDIKLVFNGVSRNKFDKLVSERERIDIKKSLGIQNNKTVIGFVGTYQHKKGIDILLDACSKLNDKEFNVILVGDGDKKSVIDNVIKFELQDKVILKHFQDPIKFYSIFDIFVLPSRNEGFPLVAIESMMMGVPTIRSNVSGAYDMITNNVDGYIFENENVNELKEILENLMADIQLRSKIGKAGKFKAINKFSEDIMLKKMITVYEELI